MPPRIVWPLLLPCLAFSALASAGLRRCEAVEPSTHQTVQLLRSLNQRTNNRLLIGQNLGHADWDEITPPADQRLALLGVDYGFDRIPADLSPANKPLIAHARQGGLVTVSMHPANPWTGGGSHDTRVGKPSDLLNSAHPAGRHWHTQLDRVARGLRQLQQANVVVLWRPLHEMNGDWFWWSRTSPNRRISPSDFVRLWRSMYQYLTEEKQLNNLVWVYAPNAVTGDSTRDVLEYYPGDDVVDVVGLDFYSDDMSTLRRSYQRILQLNKPLGLTEFGPLKRRSGNFDSRTLLRALKDDYPNIRFVLFWHSWPGAKVALHDQRNYREVLNDAGIVTRDELPTLQPDPISAPNH